MLFFIHSWYNRDEEQGDYYMYKKAILTVITLLSVFFFYACGSDSITLPNLDGMTRSEAINALSVARVKIVVDYVTTNENLDDLFAYYGDDLSAGDAISPDTTVTVFFYVVDGIILPDLTGLGEDDILDIILELDVALILDEEPNNNVEVGMFSSYGNDLSAGDVIAYGSTLRIYLAVPDVNYTDQLLITKYIEGSETNQAIEIKNVSDVAIDLTDYEITVYQNGSMTNKKTVPLEGTIGAGETRTIVRDSAYADTRAYADILTSELVFDGNDTVAITYFGTYIVDAVGRPEWTFFFAANESYIRRATVLNASGVYNSAEWMMYMTDYVEILGDEPLEYPTSFMIDFEQFVGEYLDGGISRVTLHSSIDGDTARFIFPGETEYRSVRFVGIDTPETYPNTDPWGPEAKAYTASVLENATEIWVAKDPTTGLYDGYERNLGLIWVDGVLLNYELVRLGHTKNNYSDENMTLVFENVSLDRWFKNAEAEAKAEARNIWS